MSNYWADSIPLLHYILKLWRREVGYRKAAAVENDAEPCFQAFMQFEVVTSVSRPPHGLGGGDDSHFRLLGREKIDSQSCSKDITLAFIVVARVV